MKLHWWIGVFSTVLAVCLSLLWFYMRGSVEFVSDINEYQLVVEDAEMFKNYLQEIRFFGENKVTLREQERQKVTVRKLVVHLSEGRYTRNIFRWKDGVYLQSTKEVFSNGRLDLWIGLNKDVYFQDNDLIKASGALALETLLATYELAEPEKYYAMEGFFREALPEAVKRGLAGIETGNGFIKIIKKQ